MTYSGALNFVPADDLALALNAYQEQGATQKYRIFTLTHPQGHAIRDRTTFLETMIHTFPMDPPIEGGGGDFYMAVLDSLQGGLSDLEEDLIDIVWCDVDQVAQWSVPTLIEGVYFLLMGTDWLQSYREGKRRISIRILLVYRTDVPAFRNPF